MRLSLAASTVKEICKAGFPGALKFGRENPLSVSINASVKTLRISIPEHGILNIQSLKLRTAGDKLPLYKVTMSSIHPQAGQNPASLLLGTGGIHTNEEAMPWWQVQFEEPVHILELNALNRDGKWGARAAAIRFEWTDDQNLTWVFDNISISEIQKRIIAFSERLRLAFGEASAHRSVTEVQRDQLDQFWISIQEHFRKMETALSGCKVDVLYLEESRSALIQQFLAVGTACDQRQLQSLEMLSRSMEGFLWNGPEAAPASMPEVDLAAYIFGFLFHAKGSVPLPRLLDIERLLGTEDHLERFESEVEKLVVRLGGDTSVFPIQVKAHGMHGSTLRRHEDKYVEAVRDVIVKLFSIKRPAAICYGTLLGAVREGRLLSHDDDVDVAFLAASSSEEALIGELQDLIVDLRRTGVTAQIEPRFLFLKIQAHNGLFVDAFPIVRSANNTVRMYMERLTIRDVAADIVLPFEPVTFYGQNIPAPRNPEAFLQDRYGKTWRTPDRFYGFPWNVKRKRPFIELSQ